MSTQFEPLKQKGLRPEVARTLREAIFEGLLKPGEQIPEVMIAAQLGISRSPLREALLTLEKEGLVEIKPHRGAFVRTMGSGEIQEILSLRFPLEVMALNLARENMTPQILEQLSHMYDDMMMLARRGDVRKSIEEEVRFHKAIWAATGHELLYETLVRICTPWFAFAEMVFGGRKIDPESVEVHHALIDFLAGATELSAVDCMRHHFSRTSPPLSDALKMFPGMTYAPADARNGCAAEVLSFTPREPHDDP